LTNMLANRKGRGMEDELTYKNGEEVKLEVLGQLKHYLKQRGIKQAALGRELGVARGHVSQMLSGVRGMQFWQFLRIVEITGFVPRQFIDASDDSEDLVQMDAVQNRELFVEILKKLYRLDRAGAPSLIKANAYLEGLVDATGEEIKKKSL
jgi:transcriptional regulator with XRE-family HTH domain